MLHSKGIGRGIASRRRGGVSGEAACTVLLTGAVLFLAWFTGLDLSVSSSLHVVERSDMDGVEGKERLPVREKMAVSWGRELCQDLLYVLCSVEVLGELKQKKKKKHLPNQMGRKT